MANNRKILSDSVEGQILKKANLNQTIPPPAGFDLNTDEERTLWNILTSARDITTWRDMELALLHKMVGIEMDIRRNREEVGGQWMIDSEPNKQLQIIDRLEKQFLSIVRTLSLGTAAGDAKGLNSGGVKAKEKADHNSRNEKNVVSLIA